MNATQKDMKWFGKWRKQVLPDPAAQQAFAFQERLLAAQDQLAPARTASRDRAISALLEMARLQVPYYQDLLGDRDLSGVVPDTAAWAELPILARGDLQSAGAALKARHLPAGYNATLVLRSSGSTGEPVEVTSTNITDHWQKVLALRATIWAQRDFSKSLGVIRKMKHSAAPLPEGETFAHWAETAAFPFVTGPRHALNALAGSTDAMFGWLVRKAPDYLLTYPSILSDLVDKAAGAGAVWRPRGIQTLGETVEDDLRARVKSVWGIGVNDVYSAQECGVIAIQCPSHGNYHIQTEVVHVDVIGDTGKPVAPGQAGQVVVTTLANPATPLIRYAIGDHAVLGKPCACGRKGPVLARILGRERNIMVTPQGRFWPSFGSRGFHEIAPITAMQFRQTAPLRLEMHFIASRAP
ncbi:MAG: hypothetical protein U1D06_12700, partial [Paracoccaceae bacterium]|nr:hypothetical protein [Paracoccaceae bacterium]